MLANAADERLKRGPIDAEPGLPWVGTDPVQRDLDGSAGGLCALRDQRRQTAAEALRPIAPCGHHATMTAGLAWAIARSRNSPASDR